MNLAFFLFQTLVWIPFTYLAAEQFASWFRAQCDLVQVLFVEGMFLFGLAPLIVLTFVIEPMRRRSALNIGSGE